MKRQWHIRRTIVATSNGQQCWDQAYQLLLRWAQADAPAAQDPPPALPCQEVSHASSSLCTSIDVPSSPAADD